MAPTPTEVVTHPLVLLSIVDHYNRVAKDISGRRVVGVLLGTSYKGKIDVTNSFAVPFEEDRKNPSIWYLDHVYLEKMFHMFHRVQAKERIVGFYSTGPKIREPDLAIDTLIRRFCNNPVFVIIDVRSDCSGIPTKAYGSVEEVEKDGKQMTRTFKYITSSIGAFEAEEVGVEHLLRDVNDPSASTLANKIKEKMSGLGGLHERLQEMEKYLQNVLSGRIPVNHQILYNIQKIFNLLPSMDVEELKKSMLVKTNDSYLVMYISAMIRSIVALHGLVQNKLKYREDGEEPKKTDEKKDEGDTKKEGKDKEETKEGSEKSKK